MKKQLQKMCEEKHISLNLAGVNYRYIYNPLKGEVYTEEFPDIPVERVYIACGHYITHDQLRGIIEEKLGMPTFKALSSLFS